MSAPLSTPLWDAADWLDFYHERAAILEHDGGISLAFAEYWAWEACRVEALVQISRMMPIIGSPSPTELVEIMAGRIRTADAMLAAAFQWKALAA